MRIAIRESYLASCRGEDRMCPRKDDVRFVEHATLLESFLLEDESTYDESS